MNRKKKVKQTLLKKAKKANAKLRHSNKPKYISKADRALLEQTEASESPSQPEGPNEVASKVASEEPGDKA
ncbi:DUF2986 domain-containing protein [Ferrimonas marina]|uniref:DUF2986 domain-containing protein n=1 Tax=Ferrimonas marina TaxID=299255 RepID=A0A1M5VZ34_9GAMM|nr:DUF2986 domain-containing protein [Ferrimonas marina]SHH80183.1 Protein of unknown function [Ferrimonas marina]